MYGFAFFRAHAFDRKQYMPYERRTKFDLVYAIATISNRTIDISGRDKNFVSTSQDK